MMELAFYKGKGVGGSLKVRVLHWGIARVSNPHTHAELVFSDRRCWSSEYGVGPRYKTIAFSHPGRWTFKPLTHITPAAEARILCRANVLNALRIASMVGYDTRGAVGCTITGRQNPWDYFCSEGILDVIGPELCIPLGLNHKVHPQKLLEIIDRILLKGQENGRDSSNRKSSQAS